MTEVELGTKAFLILFLIGALSGLASVWCFRCWCHSARLQTAKNRILAHLLEIRLFASEPVLILKAQRDLIAENFRLLHALSVPMLILLVPFAALFVAMEATFGRAPLRSGEPAVVTVQCKGDAGKGMPNLQIASPVGIEVETPAVRIPQEAQTCWRLRPMRASAGELIIRYNNRAITKSISAKSGLDWISERRSGWAATLIHPFEPPFTDRTLQWIEVRYPYATVFGTHWAVWFIAGAFAGAPISLLRGLRKA